MGCKVITAATGGLQEPISGAEARYETCLTEVNGSSTAKALQSFLSASPLSIGVLLIDEGFDSMYIPPSNLTSVPELKDYSGGIAVLNVDNPMKMSGKVLPLGVSLMHELGHAKQYIEKPSWFVGHYEAATKKSNKASQLEIENDNVQRHEQPICEELKLPFRTKYD